MVEIKEVAAHKEKRILTTAILNIKSSIEPDYELLNERYTYSKVFADIYKIKITEKKRWLSNKTYTSKDHIKLGWICFQEQYGVYLYDADIHDATEVSKMIEKGGYKVTILVEEAIE